MFTPAQNSTVTSGTFNDVNQLTSQNPPGPVPVQFKGTVNEPATVAVNGQSAQVTPDPDSAVNGRIFSATLNLPTGNNTVTVVAEDFGAGNPPGTHHGGNTTTKNYSLTVAAGAAKTFAYDNNGNCTANGSVTYEWDAEDRLVAINNGPVRSEFIYDGFGRRVRINEKLNGAPTKIRKFVWYGAQLAEERTREDQLRTRFYAEGQIQYLPSTLNLYYTRDHLGSIREVTDIFGTVRARYDYDPYGRVTKVSGNVDSDFLYTGHFYHAPSGLHLALYRAYDAGLGRWLNRDPIGEEGGINLYGYVENDPMNFLDPDGLEKTSKFVVSLLNAANAGRLYAVGMIKVAVGSGVEITGVGAAPGAATIGWGLWNLKGADAAHKRALKQWNECKSEEWGWNNKNLLGLAPFGAGMDDDNELSPIDVARGIGRNLEGNPKEFISDSAKYLWDHKWEILGELATLSF